MWGRLCGERVGGVGLFGEFGVGERKGRGKRWRGRKGCLAQIGCTYNINDKTSYSIKDK